MRELPTQNPGHLNLPQGYALRAGIHGGLAPAIEESRVSDQVKSPAAHDHTSTATDESEFANRPNGETDARHQPSTTEPGTEDAGSSSQDGGKAPESRRSVITPKRAPQREERAEKDSERGSEKEREPEQGISTKLRSHWIAVSVAAIVLIGSAIGGFFWYRHSLNFASTDDAFIDGRPVSINPQVTGTIVAVPVTDNQIVKVGDLLLQIDDRDYIAAVNLANAQIEQAQASVVNFVAQISAQESQIVQASTQVVSAQATLDFSKDQNVRYQDLVQKGAGTAQRAQQASSEFQSTGAALNSAQAAQKVAEGQISVLKAQQKGAQAQVAQAQAQRETADANLTRTKIYATIESRVTKLTAAPGQLATNRRRPS